MEIGFGIMPRSLGVVEEVAQIAEQGGATWLGLADSPYLFADPHVATQAALRVTNRIRIGTFVTNPVTRHWSVQSAIFRTLAEIAPDRLFLGIGAGDSAVHSVGLRPASPARLAEYVQNVRSRLPDSVPVMVAAGGPRAVRRAAAYADHLVFGQGRSPEAIETLSGGADAQVREPGLAPLVKWIPFIVNLVAEEADVAAARADVRATLVAFSRQAFDGPFDGKGVPAQLQPRLRALFANYTFDEHSVPGDSSNARLLSDDDRADLETFLFDRFTLVGTPEAVAERLLAISRELGIDHFILTIEVSDPIAVTRLAAEELLPRLPLGVPA